MYKTSDPLSVQGLSRAGDELMQCICPRVKLSTARTKMVFAPELGIWEAEEMPGRWAASQLREGWEWMKGEKREKRSILGTSAVQFPVAPGHRRVGRARRADVCPLKAFVWGPPDRFRGGCMEKFRACPHPPKKPWPVPTPRAPPPSKISLSSSITIFM